MEFHAGNESRPRALLRLMLSQAARVCYGLLGRQARGWLGRMPGASGAHRRLLKPLLFSPGRCPGLAVVAFPTHAMLVRPSETPAQVSLGRPWEPATTRVFQSIVRRGDTVVDVGAHWGYYTVLAGRLCGPDGRVFAFEPHPGNFELLAENVAFNGLSNVILTPKAASDHAGVAELHLGHNPGTHSIAGEPMLHGAAGRNSRGSITVETTALDDFFSRLAVRPRLLKMDIEGAEPLALNGMDGLVRAAPDMAIILEVNPHHLDTRARGALFERLVTYGFSFMLIDDEANELELAPRGEVLHHILGLRAPQFVNLLCMRDQGALNQVATFRGAGPPARREGAPSVHTEGERA